MKVVLKQPNKKPMRATAFFAVASPGPMTDLGDVALNLNFAHSTKDAKTYDAVMEHLKARMLHEEALRVSVSVGSYFEETEGSLFRRKPVECLPMDGYPYMVDGISAGIYMTIDEVCKLLYAEEILSEKMQSELRLVIVYEQLTGSGGKKGIEFLTVSISDIYLNNQRDNQFNECSEASCDCYRINRVNKISTRYLSDPDHILFIPLMNTRYEKDYLTDGSYIESPERIAYPSTMERFILPWDIAG
jgi:hypothetical protein